MRRVMALIALLVASCSPRIQREFLPIEQPANTIVPFEDKFLRFAETIQCFEQDDTLRNSAGTRIVFTGSSSIAMWRDLVDDMPGLPVLNRGFGGATLPEVNYYFDQLITPHCPDVVVLYCGENDIMEGQSARDVYQSFVTFAQLMAGKAPQAKLIYVGMKPSPARWHKWTTFQRADAMIRGFLNRHHPDKWQYVDISQGLFDANSRRPDAELYLDDQLHLNRFGYNCWKDALYPIVREAFAQVGA